MSDPKYKLTEVVKFEQFGSQSEDTVEGSIVDIKEKSDDTEYTIKVEGQSRPEKRWEDEILND